MKKRLSVILAVFWISGLLAIPSFAAITRIRSVSLDIQAEIEPGETVGEETIEIRGKSNEKYTVAGWEVLNPDFMWEASSVPEVKVTLYSEAGYKFGFIGEEGVKVTGTKYEFLSSKRGEKDTMLVLHIRLKPLYSKIGEVEDARLLPDGTAVWSETESAGSYEIIGIRDGKRTGKVITVYGTQCQLTGVITKAGDYSYRIRPVSKFDGKSKGDWVEAEGCLIEDHAVELLHLETEQPLSGSWEEWQGNWIYKNPGGQYASEQWQYIQGSWYYFDEFGYMVTGWVDWNGNQYYCQESGVMLQEDTTPDGSYVGSDGAKAEQGKT